MEQAKNGMSIGWCIPPNKATTLSVPIIDEMHVWSKHRPRRSSHNKTAQHRLRRSSNNKTAQLQSGKSSHSKADQHR